MTDQELRLTPGTLSALLAERTEHARLSGALQFLPTTVEVIEQDGIPFQVRIVESLAGKRRPRPPARTPTRFFPMIPIFSSRRFHRRISPC